jgi:putative endonuclease
MRVFHTKYMRWFVYIAQARTKRYYVGISTNPTKRMLAHNSGRGAQFAIDQGPLVLVYTSSAFADKSSARMREIQIKKWTRVKKEQLIQGTWK